jgi:ribonuclease R
VTPLPGGRFRLLVSIADVSFYVRPGTELDREAFARGNSVYFPDRAIPMLPESLSAETCSLRPGVDRLAMTVDTVMDGEGRPERPSFYASVIRSEARMTYAEVTELLDGPRPEWLLPYEALARALIRRREREGSIDFELPEPCVYLDAAGEVVDVRARPRTLAHRMIEEFMLSANRAVAERLSQSGKPAVYRIHEPPEASQLEALAETFGAAGVPIRDLSAPQIAAAMRQLAGRPQRYALHFLMLRAMKQARYSHENIGHFALNFERYLHFTSPIRRYADLAVHRILKALLSKSAAPRSDLVELAEHTSERERAAQEAERSMVDIYRAEFMGRHVGEVFDGVISGVARVGLFVTLEPHFVDGLVPSSTLPDYYDVDDRGLALVARRSGKRFALGDRVRVRVDAVDTRTASVSLALEGDERRPSRRGARRS